ncbi:MULTISPECIES: DUF4232 domain-containing protein [Pseudonocardia]|uniref:DUF4232 domain-containing protein n=2 Tax=Pseudonocardia TaxID=1847 RepID=A0A1Y2N6H2_PSEAH|nr:MULTISPECIES: DUF4232 domain-containing protein [Pseudonocardia]OSY43075.1 hypothetical protein BG845_00680 [Pseudonocardia autotrophica]TDN71563.1 uncharacterized protein DUF4232 [Pseudonocardia autotrophica]BBG02253.1 hypothetical protein Pdca_34620 [Pseudonocardia autotrophica]GEC23412.1 hypothetical protein PSA01_04410 [Pseudonocardia saturnea]
MADLCRPGAVVALLVLAAGCAAPALPAPAPTAVPNVAAVPEVVTPGPPEPAAPAGPAGPCTGDTLDVSATPVRPDGDAGVQELIFRNTGAVACVLDGYPGVSFVAGNEGAPVGPRAAVEGPRARVQLEPGRAATAALRVTATDSYPARDCAPQEVRGIRVAPPGGTGGRFVPRPGPVCSAEPDQPQATVASVVAR